jgi:release factor glutamine methyltransferase
MWVCDVNRGELITHASHALSANQAHRLDDLVARRLQGEPVAYLTGRREFWSLPLKVTPATLIPRPETELLVEIALTRIPQQASWTLADLGTGGGAIALALASERPDCRVLATEQSRTALTVARENADALGIKNVEFRHGDWTAPLGEETFDLVVSNPPYVRRADPSLFRGDVRFEPRDALIAGEDGLDAIRRVASQAPRCLKNGGRLLLEHGDDQADAVAGILRAQGYHDIVCHRDLAGRDRVSEGRLN